MGIPKLYTAYFKTLVTLTIIQLFSPNLTKVKTRKAVIGSMNIFLIFIHKIGGRIAESKSEGNYLEFRIKLKERERRNIMKHSLSSGISIH